MSTPPRRSSSLVARIPLRSVLWTLAVIGAVAAVAVVVSTALLTRAITEIERDTSARASAAELESELLSYGRINDLMAVHPTDELRRARLHAEARIERLLREAEKNAPGAREAAIVSEARSEVNALVAATREAERRVRDVAAMDGISAPLGAALQRAEWLQDRNDAAVAAARRRAERIELVSDIVAVVALLLASLTPLAVIASRRYVALPLAGIAEAIQSFRPGRPTRRAPEQAPAEVSAVARAFNETAEALSAQRRNQLAFVAGVVHDLRNPIHALKTAGYVLSKECDDRGGPRARATISIVQRQAERLNRMVGDLLDAAHIESGELRLEIQPVDSRTVARQCVDLFSEPSTEHEIQLVVPESPVTVQADRARLEQVVVNLVENAIKYSPAGTLVKVEVRAEGDEAVLAVSDQGQGMAPETIAKIFEPFHRGQANGLVPGTGLGLSIVRRIVNAHGGRIEVESAVGKGSTFRVRLPRNAHR